MIAAALAILAAVAASAIGCRWVDRRFCAFATLTDTDQENQP